MGFQTLSELSETFRPFQNFQTLSELSDPFSIQMSLSETFRLLKVIDIIVMTC